MNLSNFITADQFIKKLEHKHSRLNWKDKEIIDFCDKLLKSDDEKDILSLCLYFNGSRAPFANQKAYACKMYLEFLLKIGSLQDLDMYSGYFGD